jgi:4-amino-4-deoxy-L-arabinose transferase-like glycosyltransferase
MNASSGLFPDVRSEAVADVRARGAGRVRTFAGGLVTALHRRRALLAVLGAALILRAAVALSSAGLPALIEDEQHYVALAANVHAGHGFGWSPEWPTSIRPPLYPLFIATIWTLAGDNSPDLVRWAQIPVALAGIVLLYQIGCRWFGQRPALVAAAALAVYPSLLFSGATLLTEVLFTTLVLLFVRCFLVLTERTSPLVAATAGVALGVAALTRSILWPFIVVAVALLWFLSPGNRWRRAAAVAALALGYAAVVGPWAARNTALQGTPTVVDTMGGLNLMMGNYAHTPEDRMWDAVAMTGDRAWSATLPPVAPDGARWTEGTKEKWAQRQALAYMRANPATTLKRSLLKFGDFWGLERDFIAGVQRGYYDPPRWFSGAAGVTTVAAYVATSMLALVGIFLAAPAWRVHVVLLGLVLFMSGVHSVVFGHSRYHLPLVPILLLYAAAAVTAVTARQLLARTPASVAAVAMVLGLLGVWSYQLVVRDWDRIAGLLALS